MKKGARHIMIVVCMNFSSNEAKALWHRLIGFTEQRAGRVLVTTTPPSPKVFDVLFEQGFYSSTASALVAMKNGSIQYRNDEKDVLMIMNEKSECTTGLYKIGRNRGMEVCKNGKIKVICTKEVYVSSTPTLTTSQ